MTWPAIAGQNTWYGSVAASTCATSAAAATATGGARPAVHPAIGRPCPSPTRRASLPPVRKARPCVGDRSAETVGEPRRAPRARGRDRDARTSQSSRHIINESAWPKTSVSRMPSISARLNFRGLHALLITGERARPQRRESGLIRETSLQHRGSSAEVRDKGRVFTGSRTSLRDRADGCLRLVLTAAAAAPLPHHAPRWTR